MQYNYTRSWLFKGHNKKRVLASDIDANQKKTPMKEIIGHEGLISHFCRHYNSWHSVKIIKKFSFSCTAYWSKTRALPSMFEEGGRCQWHHFSRRWRRRKTWLLSCPFHSQKRNGDVGNTVVLWYGKNHKNFISILIISNSKSYQRTYFFQSNSKAK